MRDEPGRNDPCPCGSGKKFKKCCINKTEDEWREWFEADCAEGRKNLEALEPSNPAVSG